ncbi:TRAP transporter substrate-binding protein [Stappia indica]|jgi:C4-dicarboxylate-binding protein DctP|uniref:DctP family TRAP transporter solute-binding subunit n=1 Tax=Stappia indica TaxID=538381 RepID=A0A857C6Y2_9HYPH|nr:TRAP transporter substrate-binding protein [Stappia indica]QGZ34648.1 DctP family TRAP transporter solute-binding subunit [Stappia indica]
MTHTVRKLAATAVLAVAGVAFSTGAFAADFVAKIGHLESTQQSRHVHLEKVAALVAERTNGAVEFQIFPQGQLGQQREMTEGVQLGSLEATVAPAAFLGGFNPVVSILDIPFLLPEDDAKAQELRSGTFGKALCESFESRGVECLMLWPNGRKNFSSSKPLASMEDFSGQKFRVMDSSILIEQFKSVGASAIALPFGELYTSLQTGVVDAQENPLDTIRAMKFYEVQKYLVLSNHGAMEDVILFNPTFWASLPEEYRTIITDAFAEVVPDLIAHKKASVASSLEEIKAAGVEVRELSAEEKAAFRETMYPAARNAYIQGAGEEGLELVNLYEQEYATITK